VGLAPDARLLSYRVFDDDGAGTSYGPVNAIRQAVRDGADVISLSLSYREPWTPLRDAVQTAARAGVVVVAAAGNGGFFSDEVFYPAAWRETIAVGATDRGGVTIYSTRADYIDLYAPGTVTLLSSTGPHAYRNHQGTSYATPYVAGTVALLLEAHPDATLEQVRGWLTGSTVPHGSAMLLQVEGALAASGHQPAPLTPAPVLSDWCPADSPTMFDDLDGDMAVAAGCLARDGIAYGTSHDRFGPDRTLTRGQLASFVTRAVDSAGLDLPASDDVAFSDVHGSGTHDGAVMELAAAGIVAGYSDGTFRPDAPVTRAHVTKYLVEAFEVATGTPAPPQTRRWFNDTATATLAAFINRAATAGWAHPADGDSYGPNMPLSRVDMAAFLTRWTADLHRSQNS